MRGRTSADKKHNIEKTIISALIFDPKLLITCSGERLKPEHFTGTYYKDAYTIMQELNAAGKLTVPMIKAKFEEAHIGIEQFTANPKPTDETLMKELCHNLIEASLNESVDNILSRHLPVIRNEPKGSVNVKSLKKEIDEIVMGLNEYEDEPSPSESMEQYFDVLNAEMEGRKESTIIRTKTFPTLDFYCGGFRPGYFVLLSGFSSHGKTSFGVNLIYSLVAQGIPCAIISCEMETRDIQDKFTSIITGEDAGRLRNPKRIKRERLEEILSKTRSAMQGKTLIIDDKLRQFDEIENQIRHWKNKFNISVVMIDYLQRLRITDRDKVESRFLNLEEISRKLKDLAKEQKVIIIAQGQLGRPGEENPDASNIAGSIGALRDADIALTIYKRKHNGKITVKEDSFTIGGVVIEPKEDQFVVKVDKSRYSASGGKSLLRLIGGSRMVEYTGDK